MLCRWLNGRRRGLVRVKGMDMGERVPRAGTVLRSQATRLLLAPSGTGR